MFNFGRGHARGRTLPPAAEQDTEEQQQQVRLEVREPTPADLVDSLSSTHTSTTTTPATVSALSQEHVTALLNRLPPIKEDKEDLKEFFQREKTAPPAKTGKVEQQPFPPPVKQEKPAELLEEEKKSSESALSVLRYTPEGEVDNSVPYLSVTFSQPMIVLSSIDNVEKQSIPVHISPEPKNGGRFRWVGTQTLLYEPTYRFDMATDYKVKIDATIQSVKGHKLGKEVSFSFSTPPAVLQNYYPSGDNFPINEFPFFYLAFDQQVDPQKVLDTLKVTADGSKLSHQKELHLSSSDKVKEFLQKSTLNRDKFDSQFYTLQSRLDNAPAGRHLWFSIDKKVGLGKEVQVSVGPGVPSLEGPRVTKDANTFQLKNYDQFKVVSHYPTKDILPLQCFSVNLSNPLDLELFDEKLVKITPEIPNFQVVPIERGITIIGKTKGRTTYTVHIDRKVQDVYGQSLDKDYDIKFEVGPAGQTFKAFYSGLVVVDASTNEKPVYSVVTVNLKEFRAVVCAVKPEEFSDNLVPWGEQPIVPPGTVMLDEVIQVKEVDDEPVETQIELSKYLQFPKESLGQLFVFVQPTKAAWKNEYCPREWAWLQFTKLALDAFATVNEKVLAWVTSLKDGSPVTDVKFSAGSITAAGNEKGIAEIKIPHGTNGPFICRHGNDVTFLRYAPVGEEVRDSFTSQTFSDRGLYKPTETVNIKGFVRDVKRTNEGSTYDLTIPKKGEKLRYQVTDSRYQTILEGTTELTGYGSFSISFPLPDNVNLGKSTVNFVRESMQIAFNADFDIQEFRTPEYSVKLSVPPRNYQVNGKAVITTTASYYSGGGLGAANVNYTITAENSHYSPPNWSEYRFQYVQPFWGCFFPRPTGVSVHKNFEGRTDGNGEHLLCVEVQESQRKTKVPVTVKAESSVQDINRQSISSSTSFLVHPSSLYVGMKTKKTFLLPGEKLSLDVVVTDIDGKAVKDVEVSYSITTTKVTRKGYKSTTTTPEVQKGSFRSSDKAITQEIEIKEGGYFHAKLQLADAQGRVNETAVDFTVYGGETKSEVVASRVEAETLTLIPDKETYQVGDEAKILVQSPFSGPAEGLFIVSCSGPVFYERFSIKSGSSATITFPLKKEYAPNLSVNVSVVGQNSRKGASHRPEGGDKQPETRPAYAVGSVNIDLPPNYSKLQVEVKPKDQYLAPGSSTEVEVFVKSADGHALADSEVTLVVVDEAVLSLTNYSINPAIQFFTPHSFYPREERTRPFVVYKDWSTITVEAPPVESSLFSAFGMSNCCKRCCCACACNRCCDCMPECCCCCCNSAPAAFGAEAQEAGPAIQVRSNFCPLAAYIPNAQTGADGKVSLKIKLPDNLTRYRVTAVSVKDAAFCGVGESFVVAQLPVAIRPSLPRFLNFGDHADFCCVLQNQGDRSLTVHVAARSTNLALRDHLKTGYSVVIPAMGRADLSFPMETVSAGIARFQIGATVKTEGVSFSDAVEKEIRVFTPATSEAFATYGELEETADLQASFQPIQAPSDVFPQFGALEVSTSSTALQALTDAFLYLYNYKFDCNEQRASRLISIVALKDVLAAFKVSTLPSQEKLNAFISDSLGDLQKNQKPDGSFGFWQGSSTVSPYVTVHVAHCYARCQLAKYAVAADNIGSTVNALVKIDNLMSGTLYTKESKWAIKAYAAYVLALLNKTKEASDLAHNVWKESGGTKGLQLEPMCWLAFALFKSNGDKVTAEVTDVLKELQKKTNETAETANFVTSYGDKQANKLVMLHSNIRTDAIALETLLYVDSKNSLITKVAKGLLAHRTRGRWGSTQENVFALLALEKYFHTREGKVPNFHASVWLGDEFAGEQEWSGRSTDTKQIKIPMAHLMEVEKKQSTPPPVKDLVISKKGEGRLYFRVGMTYAPRSLKSEPRDYGFMVERWYEGAAKKEHVQKEASGEWKIKAGELVRVHLRITNVSRRYQVAVVDMLPAGLEVLNPDLRTTGSLPQEKDEEHSARCWWRRSWYEHQNLRDERVEAFTSLLWEGIHKYSYVARATSVGVYVVPPAKAEEMYSPEIFGRSQSDRVVVVA